MKKFWILETLIVSLILVSCSNNILTEMDNNSDGDGARNLENVRTITFYCQNATTTASEKVFTITISGSASTITSLPDEPVKDGFLFAGWWTQPNGEGTSFLTDTTVHSNISVYAKWSLQPVYQVSFMTYGGTPISVRKVTENGLLDSPGNPIRQGYLFGGWFREETCATPWNFSLDTVTRNVILHAKWDTYSWRVTFVDTSKEENDTFLLVSSPAWITGTLPPQPENGASHFAGWWTAENGKGTQFTSSTPVYSDITLYAFWTDKPVYTFSFDSQGGSPVGARSIEAGTALYEPETTIKEGYEFGGWFSELNGNGKILSSMNAVTSNKTWYAFWKAYEFNVTFDSDGATVAAQPETILVKSPEYTVSSLPVVKPIKNGYLFSGWYTEKNGEGYNFTEKSKVTQNLTVFASWHEYEYIVSFYPESGQGNNAPIQMTVASPSTSLISLPAVPERAGYLFNGWYTERDGNGERIDLTSNINSDLELYASWTKAFTVSFSANGGSGSMKNMTVPLGKSITLDKNVFTRTGFTFTGWALSSYGTSAYADSATISPTGTSLSLHATWKINIYTVSFDPNGGNGKMSPITMEYNKISTLNPVKYTRDGYSFVGWATSITSGVILQNLGIYTMGAENTRLYAIWKYLAATPDRMFTTTLTDGKVTITGMSDEWNAETGASIILPNVINGNPVTNILPGAFADEVLLESIGCNPENAFFRSKDGVLFSADMTVLYAYPVSGNSTHYAIPESVVTIAPNAFQNTLKLVSINIPVSVRKIGDSAFAKCTKLTAITLAGKTPPVLGKSVFINGKQMEIAVPDKSAEMYKAADGWKFFAAFIK